MKIWVYACCYNESAMLPWFLRHYCKFADRIIISDDGSTDGSVEIAEQHSKVTVERWPFRNGLDEEDRLKWAYRCKDDALGKCDWMLVVDLDELVTGLRNTTSLDCSADVVIPVGFNMVGDGLPKADVYRADVQLYDLISLGVFAPIYSKPIIVRPEATIQWTRGRHSIENCAPLVRKDARLKLLHFRYLGAKYTRARNARNWDRASSKSIAWSCDSNYDGPDKEGSPAWSEFAKTVAFDVINTP